jgi:AraC-like DNA-binding protein
MLPGRRAQAWRHQPGFLRPRHFHDEPELNVVIRGSAKLGISSQSLDVGPGRVVFFHPGQDHVLLEASADLQLYVIALRPELARRAGALLVNTTSDGCQLPADALQDIELSCQASNQSRDAISVEQQLSDLFRSLSEKSRPTHVVTRRALQHSQHDLSTSCEELAVTLRIDPSVLSRRFHGDMNVTLVEFRARHRLMSFIALADSGQTLTQAALTAGFGSYAQCHRVFSRVLGCAPQRYFAGERLRIDAVAVAQSPGPSKRPSRKSQQMRSPKAACAAPSSVGDG